METDMSSNYEINVEAQLRWPSLLSDTTINFPTTLLGNTSVSDTIYYLHETSCVPYMYSVCVLMRVVYIL